MAKAKSKSKGKGGPVECAPAMPSNRQTLNITKISNGYVITQSSYRSGQYTERQTFTPKQPKLHISPARGGK